MDSLIAAAARALAAGDALGALDRVALREDPPALALRGIAMAQLGEHPRARALLQRAARAFGAREAVSRARCIVADAEVALAMREIQGSPRALLAAADTLHAHGDRANAAQARLIAARRWLLLGRLDEAGRTVADIDTDGMPPTLEAVAALTRAELALRALHLGAAHAALDRAQHAARRAAVPALQAEVADMQALLERPAARQVAAGGATTLRLREVAAVLASGALVVDACRHTLVAASADGRSGAQADAAHDAVRGPSFALARRPVLFALLCMLAEAWPGDVDREALIAQVFRTRDGDETHRARLRVEIGRLRAVVRALARVDATARGFALRPLGDRSVVVLAPPIDGEQASLMALLSDGTPWSTSALAMALGASQRTVQRALVDLEAEGRVRAIGQTRARRWLSPPLAGFTTILLLPAALPFA
ncbi:MAG: helix-turn-helix domain-containing protein [Rhodoferax sp.]|nr:helix-turn-helix domain-containing protein [Rhodoferax sp.]